jgi:RNA polymerase sigma-70 factor (ECF subfamily)
VPGRAPAPPAAGAPGPPPGSDVAPGPAAVKHSGSSPAIAGGPGTSPVPGPGAVPGPGGAPDAAAGAGRATADSDGELLRRHVDGDPDAFGTLFQRHRDRLWAVAVRTHGDPAEAADALQDAMISAFRRAGGFRGDSAVTTWLHRIVVNACLDRLRRRAAGPVTGGLGEHELGLLAREPPVPDHGSGTDTALEVAAALRTLAPEQRAALVLVDMLGYPVADAAQILGVSAGTVKSRCARGRARLLPRLAHLRPGAPPGTGPPSSTPPPGSTPAPRPGTAGTANAASPARNQAPPGSVSPAERGGDSRP